MPDEVPALDIEVSPPQRQDLAARRVHHIHIIKAALAKALFAELDHEKPSRRAKPSSAKAARPPEIHHGCLIRHLARVNRQRLIPDQHRS